MAPKTEFPSRIKTVVVVLDGGDIFHEHYVSPSPPLPYQNMIVLHREGPGDGSVPFALDCRGATVQSIRAPGEVSAEAEPDDGIGKMYQATDRTQSCYVTRMLCGSFRTLRKVERDVWMNMFNNHNLSYLDI